MVVLSAVFAALTHALAADASVGMHLTDSTLVTDQEVIAGPILFTAAPMRLIGVAMTFDIAGLTGVSVVVDSGMGPSVCTAMPVHLVCSTDEPLALGPLALSGAFPVKIVAAEAAKSGDVGRLTATLAAIGVRPVARTATVRVAEPVDLVTGELTAPNHAALSTAFAISVPVRNASTVSVNGINVEFDNDWAFQPRTRFWNCRYADNRLLSCRFDQRLDRATTYRLLCPTDYVATPEHLPHTSFSRVGWRPRWPRIGASTDPEPRAAQPCCA